MSLEELIQDAVKRGEFNHLSIIPRGNGFSASFRVASHTTPSFAEDADAVEALKAALKSAKMVRAPRGPSLKPAPEPDPVSTNDDLEFG